MATSFTTVFRLQKPDFRSSGWGDQVNSNMDLLDIAIQNGLAAANTTAWANNTPMVVGQIKIDTAVSPVTYWIVSVSHTSAVSPTTFAADRVAHPSFWTAFSFSLRPRGAWAHSTAYVVNDIAYDATLGITGICKINHTSNTVGSGGTIQTDSANWDFIVNLPAMGVVAASLVSFSNGVAALSGSPTNVQTAIESLDARNDTNATTVAAISAAQIADETTIGGHTTTLASHTSSISTLNTNMTTAQNDIIAHTGRLNGLDATVAGLGTFPSTTAMLFWQAAAPTGWTKSVTHNDKALRVVNGTGGGSGGTNAFTTVFGQTATGATTITTSTMPSHTHSDNTAVSTGGSCVGGGTENSFTPSVVTTGSNGSGGSHTHGMDIRVQYLDLIICTKN